MTPHAPLASRLLQVSRFLSRQILRNAVIAACILAFLAVVPTCAQTLQQYVYAGVPTSTTASEVAAFSKDSATGALSALATSPTPDNLEGGVMTVDALGRFLFVLNRSSGKISMFTIDSSSGALQEVGAFSAASNGPNSPLPAFPSCLAVESTGQFLYVGYDVSSDPGRGAIQAFQIDSTNLQLLPLPTQFATDLDSSPIGLISALKGRFLYAGLGLNLSTLASDGETVVFQIDPVTGQLNANGFAGSARARGRSIAIDPQGRYFFEAWGTSASQAFIDAAPISPSDGTATSNVQTLLLPPGELPTALLPESSGKFLYAQQSSGVVAYSINQSTGALTQIQPATQALTLQDAHAAADPLGPYLYSLANDGIHAFQIDPQAGALSPLPGSPFSPGATGNQGLAISGTPSSTQAVSGPAASLFPSSQSFDSVTVGQPATTHVITLTNTGDQLVLITKVSIGGLNAPDFTQTATCLVSLKPGGTCSISVTFTPTAPGLRQATLTVTDNAPSGSQSVPLTGTGVAQQPEVTLAPAAFVFATPINQGSTSQPQSVSLANDGTALLHITSLSLDTTSANASDFALTSNTCSATLAVKATCVITATFSPLGNGPRSANILVVDDAPGSPQQVPLTGTGTGAPITHSGISFAPASISFPATTQNASSPGQTLTITNSGTGTLHFLAAPALGGSNPADFNLTNNCTAAAYVPAATCTLSVTFTPLGVGPRSATLVITDDAPNSPQSIAVGGLANANPQPVSAPELTINGILAQSVKAGQTATYNLTAVPNFTGNLSFACAGAPTGAMCVPPSSIKVTAGGSASFSVSIATAGASSIAPLRLTQLPRNQISAVQTLAPFLALVWVLLLRGVSRSKPSWTNLGRGLTKMSLGSVSPLRLQPARMIPVAALTVILALTFLYASGCGGGSATAQSAPSVQPTATPQGTFTITLTPTAVPATGAPTPMPPTLLTLTVH